MEVLMLPSHEIHWEKKTHRAAKSRFSFFILSKGNGVTAKSYIAAWLALSAGEEMAIKVKNINLLYTIMERQGAVLMHLVYNPLNFFFFFYTGEFFKSSSQPAGGRQVTAQHSEVCRRPRNHIKALHPEHSFILWREAFRLINSKAARATWAGPKPSLILTAV